ncbi:MAG: hypothetical protein HY598_03765 [Candidatus Omnitrophica bacterium]|nr:hypothetical protein [Candidatus Omnitrophota bacterium]
MERRDGPANQCHAHRVIASLNRQQVDFLDKIGKDAQFSSGIKLSRNQILAAMVNALKRLNLTGKGVATAEQFEQRIVDAIMSNARAVRRQGNGRGRAVKGTDDHQAPQDQREEGGAA